MTFKASRVCLYFFSLNFMTTDGMNVCDVWVGVAGVAGWGWGAGGGGVGEGVQVSYLKQHPLPTYIMFTRGKLGYRLCAPRCVLVLLSYGVQEHMRLSTHTPRSVSVWISQRTWPLSPILGQADDATMRMSPQDHGPVSSLASRHTCHAKWTLLGGMDLHYFYIHMSMLVSWFGLVVRR